MELALLFLLKNHQEQLQKVSLSIENTVPWKEKQYETKLRNSIGLPWKDALENIRFTLFLSYKKIMSLLLIVAEGMLSSVQHYSDFYLQHSVTSNVASIYFM